jgi:D-inositol-3-phosphate glycosyltransferase
MRICIVVDYYPPHIGGGEIYIQNLAEGLARGGDSCVVLTLRTEAASPRLEEKGRLRIVRIGHPALACRAFFAVLAVPHIIARGRKCDIIQAASYGGALPALAAALLLGKACVFIVYEFIGALWKRFEPNRLKAGFYRSIERLIARLPYAKFVAISRYTGGCLKALGVPDSKLAVVYGGRPEELLRIKPDRDRARKALGLAAQDFVFLAYGRAGITKGMEYFVEAIPLLLRKIPAARFVLILTPSDRRIWARIRRTLAGLPPESYRLLPGLPHDRLMEGLAAGDCIVIPSLSEGFGFAVLEACTLGKRVVASEAGSIPEVIFGDYVLARPGSAESLAEACRRAYRGELDHTPPKIFRWEETIDRFRKIYREVLGRTADRTQAEARPGASKDHA